MSRDAVAALAALLSLSAAAGCGASDARSKKPAASVHEVRWLCRPDKKGDPCKRADLASTELGPGGAHVVKGHHAAHEPKVDCFYVYPTVDLSLGAGNHEDLDDDKRIVATTITQAARFTEACALWVPLYRQVTLGSYIEGDETLARGLDEASGDVERAFAEYLRQVPATRKVVLIGHSQGAEMVIRLLEKFFDKNPAMQERLLLAMPIGGDFDVIDGSSSGGTLKNISICTHPEETGCVVAYRSYPSGADVQPKRALPPPGHQTACVNPAALDAGGTHDALARFSRSYFPAATGLRKILRGAPDVDTRFIEVTQFYAGECVAGPQGFQYLAVMQLPEDNPDREGPIDLDAPMFRTKLGLHVLDMQFAQGDLIDMIARRAAKLP